mmetsp:Transcript_14591/g.36964  ORF Transcript_14591/g.36964 Transcript_14591/m.36964 type:complete len:204 (+) Transcript_14591:180-791(+)
MRLVVRGTSATKRSGLHGRNSRTCSPTSVVSAHPRIRSQAQDKRRLCSHLEQADLLAARRKHVDGLLDHRRASAHDDNDVLRIGAALVLKQLVVAPRERAHCRHHLLHHIGALLVVRVGGLHRLEEHVGPLRSAALVGVVGVHGARAVARELGGVHQRLGGQHVNHVDLGHLVAEAEALEKMHKGHGGLAGRDRGRASVSRRR